MTDDSSEGEVFEITHERIMTVLWSDEELDGIGFDQGKDGVTIVHADGLWTLNLFLLALAWTMGPDVEPELDGYQRIYHTMAQLMMGISQPSAAPEYGAEAITCTLPAIRILWPTDTGGGAKP